MKGDLYINNTDADELGLFLADSTLTALMTPAALKDNITNTSRTEDGTRVISTPSFYKERELTLIFYLRASSREQFYDRYARLMNIFKAGEFTLRTRFQDNVIYHLYYTSCSSFTQQDGTFARISVKCNEYNPTNRA